MKSETMSSWHGVSGPSSDPASLPLPPDIFRRSHQPGGSARSSMRKKLPATPDMETQISLSAKMIDKRTSTPRGAHSYGPFFLEYSLLAEYNLIQKQRLPGLYVIPSANSPLCWFGVIFVRQGLYQEGVFRFKLHIPENFPDGDCPRFIFDYPVFHPIVNPDSGELDIRRGFPKWKRNVNHIWQVLFWARKVFYKIDSNEPLNKEAAKLYETDKAGFKEQVRECVRTSKDRVFDQDDATTLNGDPHFIRFSSYDENIHGNVIKSLTEAINLKESGASLSGDSNMPSLMSLSSVTSSVTSSRAPSGLSFLESGSLQVFSRNST